MASKYEKTNKPGIFTYRGKSGTCFYAVYRECGKLIWKKIGWDYEGVTVAKAFKEKLRTIHSDSFGKNMTNPKLRLNDIYNLYLENHVTSDQDFATDMALYNNHIRPHLGGQRLFKINARRIEEAKKMWSSLAPGSQRRVLSMINRLIRYAIKIKKYYGDNPVEDVKPIKVNDGRLRYLSGDEAQKLLSHLKDLHQPTYLVTLIGLLTGIRREGIINLHRMDIDFESDIIEVRDSKGGVDYTVTLPSMVKEILQDGFEYQPDGRLFEKYSHHFYNKAVKECGLNDALPTIRQDGKLIPDNRYKVCFHTLRHTYGTWLAKNGEPLISIKDKMGHKTIAMTMRYAKYMPGNEMETSDKLTDTLLS